LASYGPGQRRHKAIEISPIVVSGHRKSHPPRTNSIRIVEFARARKTRENTNFRALPWSLGKPICF